MSKVEFGSVRFFRRAISLFVLILIIALTVALIVTSGNLRKTKADLEYYKNENTASVVLADTLGQENREPYGYETLYPDMYVDHVSEYTRLYDAERFCYLTFAGGPTDVTEDILDVLASKNVKATFFLQGGDSEKGKAIMKRIVDEGHAIGVYGYDKKQNEIYASVETYLDDFAKEFKLIYETTGTKPNIFRFVGGTTNKNNALIRKALSAEMIRRGFTYYDWNCTTGDNLTGTDSGTILQNAIETGGEKQRIFLLMHDGGANSSTVKALPDIIKHFEDAGYDLAAITNDIQPMAFE